jgi:hypothetical protein
MLQKKFTVHVTTLPDCDDITRFDGTVLLYTVLIILARYVCCCLTDQELKKITTVCSLENWHTKKKFS